ncbi:MAG: acyltransferase [Chloroflexi bacterium]|nr:acyltransferase [Chloroflexota bacterium]
MNPAGRVASIDILRGFAIMWVIGYHLWTDLRFPNVYPHQSDAFREVPRQLADTDVLGAVAAACEAFLRVGYMGVPLFMMLSGFSLTLVSLRRGAVPAREWRRTPRRLRRLVVPYWAGFAITVVFAAALAFVQWQRHGGAPLTDYLRNGDIDLHNDQLLAGVLLVPRMFDGDLQFAPEGSLWFVLVVVQYYLLFPLLLAALLRVGPAIFAASTLVVTVAALFAMVAINGDLFAHRTWIEMAFPFRLVEFGAGMSLGYMVARRSDVVVYAARMPDVIGAMTVGAIAFVSGCLISPDRGYLSVIQWPLIIGGLALVSLPLLARMPGRLELVAPARAFAWVGVVSYTTLIVSEPLRSITHTLRAEHAAEGWLALWVVAGFVPLTLLLARPLALGVGLVEGGSSRTSISDLVWGNRLLEGATADNTPPAAP